ncbi:putative thioredoxin [Actinoplanes missouriensis 431]|uniref:Thioredoxin n=1 Tax=Actinoplanes missouriensis (strain ATCC 14538 / DSM 43046 / CBS 188.64 / JCM 3121 / NBRC 102363 / NCIMB 12654 / NRRL B-3342 / UNCC 431) TaxID=512565 RepID=I0HHK1_ACTM4|nr:thioredoxin [Actinoplanes missouriensis]BAL92488.1 putative thioredoxin [Actinoplanes missouriensis 431]
MPDESLLTATDQNFAELVLASEIPVVVDFWAQWCPPCGPLSRVLAELADEFAGEVRFVTLDVDANPASTRDYRVHSMPTLLFFSNGALTNTLVGARPKSILRKAITAAASPYTNAG